MPPRSVRKPLKSLTQRYLSYEHEGERIRLPMLSVRLRGPKGNSVRTTALVDSGATATFVPPDFAELLNLEIGEVSGATGAGGVFETNLSTLPIEILKGGTTMSEFEPEVHVPIDPERVPYVILGRDTIFLLYDITFRENLGQFILRKPKKRRGRDF